MECAVIMLSLIIYWTSALSFATSVLVVVAVAASLQRQSDTGAQP